jgi:hypothetical protein
MQLTLYKALVGINIPPEQATSIVEAMNAHIDSRVSAATQPLFNKLYSMQNTLLSKIESVATIKKEQEAAKERRSQLVRWVIGTILATAGFGLAVLKATGVL